MSGKRKPVTIHPLGVTVIAIFIIVLFLKYAGYVQ